VVRQYNSETGSTFKSARNGPKSREIDRNSKNVVVNTEADLQTGSSCVLWPTFDVNPVKLGNGMR